MRQRGQILPLVAVILIPLSILVATNGERLWRGTEKIRDQKELDSISLQASTQQARALNAIAALNQALNIAARRAQIVAGSLLFLSGCASASFGLNVPCNNALLSLTRDAVPFYKNLQSLGQQIQRWQDTLSEWGGRAPRQFILTESLGSILDVTYYLDPDGRWGGPAGRLWVRRAGSYSENSVANGSDLLDCKTVTYSASQIQSSRLNGTIAPLGRHDSGVGHYRSGGQTSDKNLTGLSDSDLRNTAEGSWTLESVDVSRCSSFHDILSNAGFGNSLFGLPAPMVIEANFENRQTLLLASSRAVERPVLGRVLKTQTQSLEGPPRQWSLSEVGVRGSDLDEMNFRSDLRPLQRHMTAWNRFPGFNKPALEEFSSDLSH